VAALAGWEPSRPERAVEGRDVVDFEVEDERCPRCAAPSQAYKSTTRTVATLAHGVFVARERSRVCRGDAHRSPQVLRSEALGALVAQGQRYGYDLIVWAGRQRFVERRQRAEIRSILKRHFALELSAGTVSALCDRFLCYLGALHRARLGVLREAMSDGYPLHVDATALGAGGGLFACYDGWRHWVLHCGRIRGERTEQIEPLVRTTVEWFGQPVAVVRDQSSACKAAVAFLGERGVPDLLCHFHVVKSLGTRLLDRRYQRLKGAWRQLKAGATLRALERTLERSPTAASRDLATVVYWIREGQGGTPDCFPFGLPLLDRLERLLALRTALTHWLSTPVRTAHPAEVERLEQLLAAAEADPGLATLAQQLRARQRLFDEVRAVFRLGDPSREPQPLLPEIQLTEHRQVERALDQYRAELERRKRQATGDQKKALETLLDPLESLRDHLAGHPLLYEPDGRVRRVVPRTNNPIEHLFGTTNQNLRRRTGRKHLGRDLEDLPAEALLVHNLRDPLYLQLVAGSWDRLPHAFSRIQPLDHPLRPKPPAHDKQQLAALSKLLQHSQHSQLKTDLTES